MNSRQYRIVENTLKQLIAEAPAQETDNAASDADVLFTPAEEKFLGKFDARGVVQLGVIYNISDVGIQEFIARSGKDLNITPGILLSLLRSKTIKLVPYGGTGRNENHTIELQLSLDDIKGLGAEEKKNIEAGTASSGAPAADAAAPPEPDMSVTGPENAWVVRYGNILSESANIVKQVLSESNKKTKKAETINDKIKKTADLVKKSRVLQRLPKEYLQHMDQVIHMMGKKTKTAHEKERIIADVLDVLQVKLKLTPKEITKSYEFHKTQKRLQKFLDK